MQRTVSAHVDAQIVDTTDLVLSIAVARGPDIAEESLSMTLEGQPLEFTEVVEADGTRLHVCRDIPTGQFVAEYQATVDGQARAAWHDDIAEFVYARPSRYCESDELFHSASALFGGLQGHDLVNAVRDWVNQNVQYFSGWSRVTDGALETFLQRQGVCRDFAHLVVTLLRGLSVPARFASVYAPGLQPMDFHAVAEAYIDGQWWIVDATGLAPRASMLRIATGRDAADTAFMTTMRGGVQMGDMTVTATVDPELPIEDPTALIPLL